MQPDGTAREALSFTLNEDSIGVSNRNGTAGPYTSFGAAGCKANTLACGPDNENARGFLGAVSFFGDEWLIGAGALSADNFFRFYATNDAMTAPDFSYVDTSVTLSNGMRTATAAVVMGSKLYVGVLGTGGVRPGLVALTRAPAAPGIDATSTDVENLQAETIPGIGKSAKVSLIDSMIVFNDRLYLFNNGGCARSSTAVPAAGSWNSCTPAALRGWVAAQAWAPWARSSTPRMRWYDPTSRIMVSSIPDDSAKVNIAKSMLVRALSICFISSISGPCIGANSGFTLMFASWNSLGLGSWRS